MNFYKHFIGDFQRDTGHLSLTERGAYLALMHHYYATEKALPADNEALCRIASAFSRAERNAVEVAATFFEKRDGALWHKRIEAELEKAEGQSDTNRRIALEREARKRAEKLAQEEHEACTKRAQDVPEALHEMSTPHSHSQSLLRKEGEPRKRVAPIAPVIDGIPDSLIADFMVVRKAKKAGALTDTAIAGLRREAENAGIPLLAAIEACCEFSWAGFNAKWYAERRGSAARSQASGETAYQRSMRERAHEISSLTARRAPGVTTIEEVGNVNVLASR